MFALRSRTAWRILPGNTAYTASILTEEQAHEVATFIRAVSAVPAAEVEAFCALARERRYTKGEDFVRAGEACDELLFIHRGAFRYYLLAGDKDHTKDFSPERSFCTAFTSFVTRSPSQIFVGALEDAVVSVWQAAEFFRVVDASFSWQRLLRLMAQRLYIRKEQREISLLVDDARGRYERFIREFPTLSSFADVEERVPQHLIASYLGVTPETLSRVRRALKEGR